MAIALELLNMGRLSVGRAQALTAVVAVGDGQWIEVSGYPKKTVHVAGITVATVIVSYSNEVAPADNTHGIPITTFTADGIASVDNSCRWMKVRVSAWTSGTINAWLEVTSS